MSGFLGIGQSGAQKAATSNLQSIFNYALPQAEASETAGASNLSSAANYFNQMLTAGRTQTAQNASPAINAALAQSDAARRSEASTGTSRGGGTAEINREAGATTQANIDKIINDNMIGGKMAGAQGLTSVGGAELSTGTNMLSAAGSSEGAVLSEADQIAQNESQLGASLGGALIKALPWGSIF